MCYANRHAMTAYWPWMLDALRIRRNFSVWLVCIYPQIGRYRAKYGKFNSLEVCMRENANAILARH